MAVTKTQRIRATGRTGVPWSEQVQDSRKPRGRRHDHHGVLSLIAVGFACGRTVLRQMEDLSADLGELARRTLQIPRRISDTTLYRVLRSQRPDGLRETVWAVVRHVVR
jgi:hypothetical protein